MKGVISNFRMSRKTHYPNHMIIKVSGVDSKEKAAKLVGKSCTWKSPAGKEIKGTVAKEHGNKGAIRVIFMTGMPGQAIGTGVELN